MVRSLCMGPVVVVLALTGLAWGQPEPASAPPKELRQAVITVQEPEKPNLKARVLATWLQADGSRAFQVQALTSGEMMTVVEVGPHTRTPGANGKFFQAVATRIYHWGGTVPPAGVPMPPENHPVVAFQPTPPVSSAPTGVQMVRPTVEPARRLASNGSASRVSNENRVWPPAYGTCANCTQDPINPARAQTPPQASVGISPYTRPGRAMVAQPPVPSQPIPVVRTTPTLTAPGSQPAYPPVVTVKSVVASNGQTSEGGTVNLNHTEPVPLPVIGEEPSWPRRTLRESTTLVSQASTPNCVCDTIATPASTSPPRMGQAPTIIQRDIIQPAKSVQVRTTPQGYPAGSSQLVSQVASPNCACDTITTTTTPPPVRVVRTPVIIQKEGIQPSQPVPMRTLTQRNQTVSGPLVSQGLSPKCECETVAITKSPPGRNSQMPVMTGNDQPSAPRVVYVPAPPIITAPAPSTTTAGLASQGVPPGLIPKSPASQPGNATKSPYAVVDASTEKPKQAWTGGLLPRVFGWKDESKTAANGTGSGSTVVSRVTEPVRPANSSVGQPTPTDVNGGKNIWGNTPIVQSPLSPPVKPTQIGSTNPSMSTGQVVAGQQNPMLPRLDPPAIQTQTASSLTLAPPTGSSNPATPTTPVVGIPQNSTLLARLDPPSIQSQLGSSLPAPNPNATPSAATPATPVKPTSTAPAKPPVPENQEQTGPRPVIPFADKSKPDPLEDLGSYTKIPGLEGKLTTPKYNAAVDSGYRVKGNQSSPAPANQANPAASNGSGIPAGANTPLVKPVAPITPVAPVTPITPVAPLPENPVASSIKPTPPSATLPQTPVTPVSPVTRTGAVVPPATTTAVNVPPAPPMRAPATAPLPPGNASQAISAPAGRQSIMAAQAAAQQVTNESRHVPGAAAPISVSALEGNAFSPPAAPQGSTQPAQASVVQRTAGTSGPAPGLSAPPRRTDDALWSSGEGTLPGAGRAHDGHATSAVLPGALPNSNGICQCFYASWQSQSHPG